MSSGAYATLRNSCGADLMQMVTSQLPSYGYASQLRSASDTGFAAIAHSAVNLECFSQWSHLHELLHNVGANHDARHTHTLAHALRMGMAFADAANGAQS